MKATISFLTWCFWVCTVTSATFHWLALATESCLAASRTRLSFLREEFGGPNKAAGMGNTDVATFELSCASQASRPS